MRMNHTQLYDHLLQCIFFDNKYNAFDIVHHNAISETDRDPI